MSYNEFLDMEKFMKKSKDVANKIETMYKSFQTFRKIWNGLQSEPIIYFLRLEQFFNRAKDSLLNESMLIKAIKGLRNRYFESINKIIKE